jgi:gliding motility-associated-like protein
MKAMIKNISTLVGALLISGVSFSQANADCSTLEPICDSTGVTFTALSGVTAASITNPGNNYDCFGSSPNPTWYYMEVGQSGNLDFSLSAPQDIDFIIYGPFSDLAAAQAGCNSYGTGGIGANVIDCSYSATNNETPSIPNAQVGEIYVLLITNYAGVVQDVQFSQSNAGAPGAGELTCDVLVPDPCVSDPGTYTVWKDPAGSDPNALTQGPVYLCEGDAFSLISNNDYILPNDTVPQPQGDGIYSAQLLWLVYTAPPISPITDPLADPSYTGLGIPMVDLMDVNDASSPIIQFLGCGTYFFVPVAGDDGVGGNNNVANGTNDNGSIHWDKDGNGCFLLGDAVEVTYACEMTTNATLDCNFPTTINGMDIAISGGSGNYTVVNLGAGNLQNPNVPNGGTAEVNDLFNNAGWSIQITDSEGCIATASGTFTAPTFQNVTLTPAPDCPAMGTGQVDATITNGSGNGPTYQISMAGGALAPGTSDNYVDVAGTIVPILIMDDEGCVNDSTVTIPSAGHFIDVTITNLEGEQCWGDGNGTATISAVPTPSGSVTDIIWTDPNNTDYPGNWTNTTQTGMMPGIWTVCITDDIGCEVCVPVEITAPQQLDIYVDNSNEPVCYGFNDGSIDVGLTGGSAPLTVSWSHNTGLTGDVANQLTAGTYWAYVTDANGCQDSIEVILDEPDSLYALFDLKSVDCFGDSSGGIFVTFVDGNTGNVNYYWNTSGQAPVPPDTVSTLNNIPSGTYVITLQDENGCTNEYEFFIDQPTQLSFADLGTEPAYCRLFPFQIGNGQVFASATGGTPDYTYQWIELATGATSTNTTWGARNPGLYQITMTDANGCTLTETIQLDSVSPIADFVPSVTEGTSPVYVEFTNTSQYFANPLDPLADTTFFWNLDTDNNTQWYLSQDYFEVMDTTYTGENEFNVCLVAINKNGCTDTACKIITVYDQPVLSTPNIFTPGSDGANDVFTFEFVSQGVQTFSAVIVDRWGKTVFEFTDVTQSWDGNNKGGTPCTDGVYFYTYEVEFTNGETKSGQGNITLVREK